MKTITKIEQVLAKLDEIILWCKANENPCGYFASTYKIMTAAVLDGIKKKKFEDAERMTRLDLQFANRYFDAWDNYQQKRKITNAWFTAFEAAKNKDLLIMQHIFLGINAHINLDLGVSAAEIMPYKKINPLKNDFNKINDVIASINQEVQEALNKICYPVELVDQISQGKDNDILDFVISKARMSSWATAYMVSNTPGFLRPTSILLIDNAATLIAKNILASKSTPTKIIKLLKNCESGDIKKNIEILSSIKMK